MLVVRGLDSVKGDINGPSVVNCGTCTPRRVDSPSRTVRRETACVILRTFLLALGTSKLQVVLGPTFNYSNHL